MKNHHYFKSAAVMTAIVITLILTAGLALSCGGSKNSEAALTGITIAGNAVEKIPTPISSNQWNDEEFYFTDAEYTETVYLNDNSQLTGAQVSVVISSGAKVAYGLATGFDRPESFNTNNKPDIAVGQALYVRVTSEDGNTVNYYRFSIRLKSANSQLSTLIVAGMRADNGSPADTWGGVTAMGVLSLSNALKTDAQVVGTPSYSGATVAYALVTTAGGEPEFSDTDTYTFADGNILYVRVIAENNVDVSYYKIEVQIGRDATLASVKIGGAEADSLGTPHSEWGNGNWGNSTSTQRGTCQADERMPEEGFTVEITPTDMEATVVWARINPSSGNTTEPASYNGTSPWVFPSDASDLIIKVTSASGANTNWYRIRLITKSYGVIYKGTPQIKDSSEKFIDPIWDDEEWLDVSRLNTAESYNAWFGLDYGRHTTARAKVLWDDDGLWSYWDIDFMDYKTTETGSTTVRNASLSGAASTYNPGTDTTDTTNHAPDNAHMNDSVEFFVNERFQTYKTGNYGNQYRSGLPNADGTIWLSGEKGNPPSNPYFNPIVRFQMDKKVSAWVKTNGEGKQTGYVIIMRVPWVNKYAAEEMDAVFDSNGKVKDGAEIGLELQVNACATAGTRNGILTWNGVTSMAYQNVKSFGIVTLRAAKD